MSARVRLDSTKTCRMNADSNGPQLAAQVARVRESTGVPFDPATYQAEITSAETTAPSQVQAKFRKARGNITGVAFTGRKTGSSNWMDLGKFTVSPASLHVPITTPGQAEQWEIQARAFKGDTMIGLVSDIKTVLVRG